MMGKDTLSLKILTPSLLREQHRVPLLAINSIIQTGAFSLSL